MEGLLVVVRAAFRLGLIALWLQPGPENPRYDFGGSDLGRRGTTLPASGVWKAVEGVLFASPGGSAGATGGAVGTAGMVGGFDGALGGGADELWISPGGIERSEAGPSK